MSVQHLTTENFNQAISNGKVLVDFWASWCGPCKMVSPIIEELAVEYDGKATIAKVNTDDESALAEKYGIQGIPTVIMFENGVETNRFVGVKPKEVYQAAL